MPNNGCQVPWRAVAVAGLLLGLSGALRLDQPAPGADPALARLVPRAVAADDHLTVAIDPTYPPGGTFAGIDRNLVTAVATRLGLRVRWRTTTLEQILAGVQDGRDELGAAAIPVTDHHLSRTLMITYLTSGTQWVTNGRNSVRPDDACGTQVAVVAGTTQVDDVADRSATCATAGRPTITIHRYPDLAAAATAVRDHRDRAVVTDTIGAAHLVGTSHRLRRTGSPYDTVSLGLVVNSARRDLADTVRQTLATLTTDGTYRRILKRWNLDTASTTPVVRP